MPKREREVAVEACVSPGSVLCGFQHWTSCAAAASRREFFNPIFLLLSWILEGQVLWWAFVPVLQAASYIESKAGERIC